MTGRPAPCAPHLPQCQFSAGNLSPGVNCDNTICGIGHVNCLQFHHSRVITLHSSRILRAHVARDNCRARTILAILPETRGRSLATTGAGRSFEGVPRAANASSRPSGSVGDLPTLGCSLRFGGEASRRGRVFVRSTCARPLVDSLAHLAAAPVICAVVADAQHGRESVRRDAKIWKKFRVRSTGDVSVCVCVRGSEAAS